MSLKSNEREGGEGVREDSHQEERGVLKKHNRCMNIHSQHICPTKYDVTLDSCELMEQSITSSYLLKNLNYLRQLESP